MRVLVVEDSTAVQSFHKFALGMFKEMELDMAMDGVAAIKLLAEHRYDVVLLDINLPLMDGMKVLASMRRKGGHQAKTPVIMVTSEADPETDRRALELGAFKVLHKPVPAHAIRDAVTEALDQPAAEPQEFREKRRVPRLRIELTSMLSSVPSTQLVTFDISPFGAFLMTDEPLDVGTSLMLSISLPHLPEPLSVSATVVHRRGQPSGAMPAGVGVSFDHDSPEHKAQLEQAFMTSEDEEPDNLVTVLEVVLGLCADERVLLVTDTSKGHIASAFANAAERLGAQVELYELDEESRPLTSVPTGLAQLLDFPDVCLNVFDARPEETPFRVQLIRAQVAGGARVGHAPGITDDMLGTGALTADYREMQQDAARLLKLLEGARSAHVTTTAGSDITLNIDGRGFLTDVIIEAGGVGNLPAGEVFCAPLEDGADGVLVTDAAIGGVPLGDDPVTIHVAKGRIESVTCDDESLLAKLTPLLEVDDEAQVVGELGLGLNPRARITNNMLEGEKAGGTVHIAFGNNAEMPGGQNQSQTHRDFLMKDATIVVTYTDDTTRTLVHEGDLVLDD